MRRARVDHRNCGFAALDFDIAKLNPVRLTEHSYPVKETFDSILIESGQCNVCLLPSADGSCEVLCRAAENLASHVSVKDGVLTVQESDERAWYEHLLGGWERMRLEIMLPQSAYQSLTITSASGDVQVPEGFRFANAQITTASGGVSFLAEVEGTLSVQTTSGDISAAKAAAAKPTADHRLRQDCARSYHLHRRAPCRKRLRRRDPSGL